MSKKQQKKKKKRICDMRSKSVTLSEQMTQIGLQIRYRSLRVFFLSISNLNSHKKTRQKKCSCNPREFL